MKNVDYYPLGPRTRAWHWSRCSALCPGCVDTAQAARRVTEARALNHSYQMLWYSDIGTRHSAITLSPGSANQRPGWPRSDQSESSICSACDQIVVPGSYSLYPGRVKYQSSALTLCSISCPALHCSLLAYNTNRKCAGYPKDSWCDMEKCQMSWIWAWGYNDYDSVSSLSQYQMVRLQTPANFAH